MTTTPTTIDILLITDNILNNNGENIIKIEKNNIFGGILSNIIIQILSYELSIIKKINPDYPRNLAKVVTVE